MIEAWLRVSAVFDVDSKTSTNTIPLFFSEVAIIVYGSYKII